MSRASTLLLLVVLGACTRHAPMPIMASQLFAEGNGRHLSAYLSQRDASAAVCDLNARGPHLATIDAEVRRDLVRGLREGAIAPDVWRDCVDRLGRSTDIESSALLFDDVVRAYADLITDKQLEKNDAVRQRMAVLHGFLVGTSRDVAARSDALSHLVADLQAAIARRRLGPTGQGYAAELISDVELSHGMRKGRAIEVGTLDSLLDARDDSTLRRYALRLPGPDLRSEA